MSGCSAACAGTGRPVRASTAPSLLASHGGGRAGIDSGIGARPPGREAGGAAAAPDARPGSAAGAPDGWRLGGWGCESTCAGSAPSSRASRASGSSERRRQRARTQRSTKHRARSCGIVSVLHSNPQRRSESRASKCPASSLSGGWYLGLAKPPPEGTIGNQGLLR